MLTYELRPHHGLCIRFFRGMGYSGEFTRNMQAVITMFKRDDPMLRLSPDCDILCAHCPHDCGGVCQSHAKVHRYDTAVLALCGLDFGAELRWSDLSALVRRHILDCEKLSGVCADCEWYSICAR